MVWVATRWFTLRRLARIAWSWARPGSVMQTGFGPDAVAIKTPLAEAEVQYGTFTKLAVHDGAVVLRQGRQRVYTVLPVELFPDDALATMRHRIELNRQSAASGSSR